MNEKYRYDPLTHAINTLRKKGFDKDFIIADGQIICDGREFKTSDLKINIFYRYEGDSDPADEASAYGLETISGLKGILVAGDGIFADGSSSSILKELHVKENKRFEFAQSKVL